MSRAEVTLPAAVSSVPTARHFIESILAGWGLSDLAWDATLIVSELASNAALHARGQEFRVQITTEDDGVRVEVSDGSLRLPQQRTYSSSATTGRGLRLVDELASEWGVTTTGAGKTVWVRITSDGGPGGAEADGDVDRLLAAFDDNVVPLPEAAAGNGGDVTLRHAA
jgi:anti-sigma regulatory factor (Ser/Thr protein kinase)